MRHTLDTVQRYLDAITTERLESTRLLEDLANIEDGPDTDDDMLLTLSQHDRS